LRTTDTEPKIKVPIVLMEYMCISVVKRKSHVYERILLLFI